MGRKKKSKSKKRRSYRKKSGTYDSKESRSFMGLLFLFAGVLTLLSFFVDAPIFIFLKNITGTASLFFIILLFNLALNLFDSKFVLATKKSVVAQILFLLSISGFINSVFGGGYSLEPGRELEYGGFVGYHTYQFFSDNIFLNFTPVFFVIVMIFSLPIILSMPITQFLEVIGKSIQKVINSFNKNPKQISEKENEMLEIPLIKPATFGDFRKKDKRKNHNKNTKQSDSHQKNLKESDKKHVSDISSVDSTKSKVAIKEVSKKGAFINEELQYPDWKLPPISLLNKPTKQKTDNTDVNKNADIIEQTLTSFKIEAKVVDVLIGPTVTQYALDIALGTKVSKIVNLSNDLALALATASNALRIEAPIPGTSYVGIEVPNETRTTVFSKEVLSEAVVNKKDKLALPIGLGMNIGGEKLSVDLQKMPHLLIAGATGSGKSVLTNSFIVSLLMSKSPDEVRFIMVDPKQVELSDYNGIPHLLTPVVTDMDKVLNALKWAINEMEDRYTMFKEARQRNIEGYNKLMGFSAIPYIVIVIDEMADMMMSTNKVETESAIVRLAQKARATGIHLVLATQRPSVNVITGILKANIPARVAMSVMVSQLEYKVCGWLQKK